MQTFSPSCQCNRRRLSGSNFDHNEKSETIKKNGPTFIQKAARQDAFNYGKMLLAGAQLATNDTVVGAPSAISVVWRDPEDGSFHRDCHISTDQFSIVNC